MVVLSPEYVTSSSLKEGAALVLLALSVPGVVDVDLLLLHAVNEIAAAMAIKIPVGFMIKNFS